MDAHLCRHVQITLLERTPFGGPLRLRIENDATVREESVGSELADAVQVMVAANSGK